MGNATAKRTAALLLATVIASGCIKIEKTDTSQDPTPPSTLGSYAIKIGRFAEQKGVPRALFVKNAKRSAKVDASFAFFLLEGGGRKILFDPGFTESVAKAKKPTSYLDPRQVLSEIGVAPGDITDVVLSCFYEDRIDAVTLFPAAKLYMQSGSLETARRYIRLKKSQADAVGAKAIAFVERADAKKRLVRLDETIEFLPGLKVHATSEVVHRWNSYFSVQTPKGVFVIGGFLVPLSVNYQKRHPIPGVVGGVTGPIFDNMRSLAGDWRRVLPSRDAQFFDALPALSAHVRDPLSRGAK